MINVFQMNSILFNDIKYIIYLIKFGNFCL